MSEPGDQRNADRDAAFEEFRLFLERMVHEFDAAGISDAPVPEEQPRSDAEENSWQHPAILEALEGFTAEPDEQPEAQDSQDFERSNVSRELKAIQEELTREIADALEAVANISGAERRSAAAGADQVPRFDVERIRADHLRQMLSNLLSDFRQELYLAMRQQEEAFTHIYDALANLQKDSHAALVQIVNDLELRTVILEDFLDENENSDSATS